MKLSVAEVVLFSCLLSMLNTQLTSDQKITQGLKHLSENKTDASSLLRNIRKGNIHLIKRIPLSQLDEYTSREVEQPILSESTNNGELVNGTTQMPYKPFGTLKSLRFGRNSQIQVFSYKTILDEGKQSALALVSTISAEREGDNIYFRHVLGRASAILIPQFDMERRIIRTRDYIYYEDIKTPRQMDSGELAKIEKSLIQEAAAVMYEDLKRILEPPKRMLQQSRVVATDPKKINDKVSLAVAIFKTLEFSTVLIENVDSEDLHQKIESVLPAGVYTEKYSHKLKTIIGGSRASSFLIVPTENTLSIINAGQTAHGNEVEISIFKVQKKLPVGAFAYAADRDYWLILDYGDQSAMDFGSLAMTIKPYF